MEPTTALVTRKSSLTKTTAGIPTIRQLLEGDVALRSAMQTETESLDEAGTILLAILTGLTENVMSSDVIELSVWRAEDICLSLGMNKETFGRFARRFLEVAKQARQKNPLHSMF